MICLLFRSFGTALFASVVLLCSALFAPAESVSGGAAPRVVVSIKPLQSLVAAVMQGAGEPALIVQGGGSPHGYQLHPQDAESLSKAQIIFWDGPQMEVFLRKPLRVLSPKAQIIALSQAPGVILLPLRAGGLFEADNDEPKSASGQNMDMHFWLDPQNAKQAVFYIAAILAKADPNHENLYQSNAKAYAEKLDALTNHILDELAPVRGRPFIVFHDAYHYFEKRFGVNAIGSVTVDPEQLPGARRLAEIRNKIKESHSVCVFSEPQFQPRLVQMLTAGANAKTGVLDPLGSALPSGPNLYLTLIQNLADNLKTCLSDKQAN